MEPDAVQNIKDYLEIPGEIYTGGQPTPGQIKSAGEAGFKIWINLATAASPGALVNEQELVMEAGMAYVHIPVDWLAPEKKDLLKFFTMFDQHKAFKTFVHCALNMRVSVFVFLYRVIVEKLDRETCWEEVIKIWEPDEDWTGFINRMLAEVHPEDRDRDWQFNWQ